LNVLGLGLIRIKVKINKSRVKIEKSIKKSIF